jgi:hypothetical protein
MQQSPSWKANCSSASQQTSRVLWDRKVQHHVHNSPQIFPFLSQLNQIFSVLSLVSSWIVSFVSVCAACSVTIMARFLYLTPWNKIIFKKLSVAQLLKKFPAFYKPQDRGAQIPGSRPPWRLNFVRRRPIQWGMLQRTMLQRMNATTNSFINKIRMLQRTKMLQRTRSDTIGRSSTRMRMTCRAFPLWLDRQSSSLLSFVRFSYQFSSVICLFVQCIKVK